MAMFDCSQIYSTTQTDAHDSPKLSPKAAPPPDYAAPQTPSYVPPISSLNYSLPTSTTSGSDNERVFSSGDEDSMEFNSDTAYDSILTKATMSNNSDLPRLEIDRMFGDSPVPEATKQSLPLLEELIPRCSLSASSAQDETSLDGLDSLSTPRDDQSSNPEVVDSFITPIVVQESQLQLHSFPSSPPAMPCSSISRREQSSLELVPSEPTDESLLDGELWDEVYPFSTAKERPASPDLPQHSSRERSPSSAGSHQNPFTQSRQGLDDVLQEKRLSIFDWSEQQRSDRDSLNGSSPRPRTVHSKQSNDGRGGRAPGRRAPNALHLRSQSVPAAKESYLDSEPGHPPAKYGTWGLGNKGVSEEWTDDFEFEEADDYGTQQSSGRSATGMKVPQAIIDRQASVHGQFGQVQEFMLLVEELKRLRHQGIMLDLMGGPSHGLWEDAENIINLATLNEDEDEELAPPQSPGFSNGFDDFDVDPVLAHPISQYHNPETEDGLRTTLNVILNSAPTTPAHGRPRGESLAQAKTFLQTIHQNRTGVEFSPFEDRCHPPKLPFDTQDLRDLVIRAGVATRALKEIVRKAEGVFTSPDRTPKEPRDPAFSQIFNRPESLSPTFQKPILAKSTSMNSYMDGTLPSSSNDRDQLGHMSLMTAV
jgi:Septation protein etd1